MNDIEHLAASIRKARQTNPSPGSADDNWRPNVDIDLPAIGSEKPPVVQSSEVEQIGDASNDSLLKDIVTDFGLNALEEQVAGGKAGVPATAMTNCDESLPETPLNPESCIDIPLEKLDSEGFITPLTGRGLLTEQYRRIKRPLLKNIRCTDSNGLNNNVIMVTSSVSGEGKTYTAINLALSLALERERSVLLIDADVLKHTASGILEVDKNTLGLTDLLAGEITDPAQFILKTNISNFTYLPSGSSQEYANELLSSTRMRYVFEELSNRYQDRIIVLDCPPILQTNEANVITDYAGQVVFVVAEEDTSQSFVVEALKQISDESYVGIVLNKSRKRLLGSDYGYTYNYA